MTYFADLSHGSSAGEQPDALALSLHDQAVAVVLDLVKPIRTGRNFGAARRDARQKLNSTQHVAG
jgi:hypothetical protein